MAVIGKIREKSTLLLIIIGGAIMAFILGDMFSSNMLFGGRGPQYLAEIDGEKISDARFEEEVQKQLDNWREQEQTAEVPENVSNQIRESVWVQMLRERIFGSQYAALGIQVSDDELADLLYGKNPHPQVVQAFTNPETGQFNPQNVIQFIKNLDKGEPDTKVRWLEFEQALKKQTLIDKYNTLVAKGLYSTDEEAKIKNEEVNKMYSFQYVAKTYNSVPDSIFEISESDARNYYNNNKSEFEQERVRSIAFVSFDIIPSAIDTADAKSWIDDVYNRFREAKDDSLFVSVNSDQPYDRNLYSAGLLPDDIDSNIMTVDSIGYMEGPQLMPNGNFRVLKVVDIKNGPDSVKARHILISFQNVEEDSAMTLADSIKTALDNGADFAALAAKYSDDPSNKQDTGNLGWFRENIMIPVINDTCFSAAVGEKNVVKSPFGMHIIEVLERSPVVKKMQFGIIERSIEPSRETFNNYFVKANQFSLAVENNSEKEINELAVEIGMNSVSAPLQENDNSVNDMESSRQIVRWAYNSNEGAVSEPFSLPGRFVVAKLIDVKEEGLAPFEKVRVNAENGARRDMKAAQFTEEMKGDDINAIASNIGTTVESVRNLSFGAYSIPKIGFEPTLLGKIFSLQEGDLSFPIKGKNGVYVIWVETVQETSAESDWLNFKEQIAQNRESRVNYEVFEALKEKANIEDNRSLFY